MKNIILIAPPAAGKGTEAALIKEDYKIPHISTGDLLRQVSNSNDPKYQSIKEVLALGHFVSDDIVISLLKDRIQESDCENGYILDGFPRNIEQAKEYDRLLESLNKDLGIVIVLDINKEIAKSRITGRLSCSKCGKVYNSNIDTMKPKNIDICDVCSSSLTKRSDDSAETYDERYNTYLEKTEPLIEYYDNKNVLYHIDASQDSRIIHNSVKQILQEVNND